MQTLGWLTNSDPRALERVTGVDGNILLVRSDDTADVYGAIKSVAQTLGIAGLVGAGFHVTKPTATSTLTYVSLWVPTAQGVTVEVDDGVFLTVRPATPKETAKVAAALKAIAGVQAIAIGAPPAGTMTFGLKELAFLGAAFFVGLGLGRSNK
jgi:hypothetical protein